MLKKKIIGAFCTAVIMTMAIAAPASANTCPTRCGSTQFSSYCTGSYVRNNPIECFARGSETGGFYHSYSCEIIQTLYATGQRCLKCGYTYGDYSITHVESAYHTSGGPTYQNCRY